MHVLPTLPPEAALTSNMYSNMYQVLFVVQTCHYIRRCSLPCCKVLGMTACLQPVSRQLNEIVADEQREVLLRFSNGQVAQLPLCMDIAHAVGKLAVVASSKKLQKGTWYPVSNTCSEPDSLHVCNMSTCSKLAASYTRQTKATPRTFTELCGSYCELA